MPSGPRLSYLPDFEGRTALYRPLDSDRLEVRVLTIWPNENFLSPLEGTIRMRSASIRPKSYDALSYYWGSINHLEYVFTHGSDEGAPMPACQMPVTHNLASALREFRRRAFAKGQSAEVWTDALCINQRDASERDLQVGTMSWIFQFSRRVCVWLSDCGGSTATERGLAGLVHFSGYFKIKAFAGEEPRSGRAKSLLEQTQEVSELLRSVGALMELPYWRRGWALQEACVWKVPVSLHLGNQSCELVSWPLFSDLLSRLAESAKQHNMDTVKFSYNPNSVLAPFIQASVLRQAEISGLGKALQHPGLETIWRSLLVMKMWHTTDPRDNVFVQLGLIPVFRELRTGYSDNVEDVYVDATEVLLRNGGSWSRSWWSLPYGSPYLPSWVIDFSASNDRASAALRMFEERLLTHGRFNASASSKIRMKTNPPQTLTTAAFICDEIQAISRCLTHQERETGFQQKLWLEWLVLGLPHGVVPTIVAMTRTFCAGLALRYRPFTLYDVSLFRKNPIASLVKLPKRPDRIVEEEADGFAEWEAWVIQCALCKRFFVTKSGRIGLAPNSAAVGDRIAIFASGDMPFVVRRVHADIKREAHILMGSCYLEGAMHGEAVYDEGKRIFDNSERSLSRFSIRQRLEKINALNPGCGEYDFREVISPMKQSHMLRKTRSLDAGKLAKAVAVELAFRDNLCLV